MKILFIFDITLTAVKMSAKNIKCAVDGRLFSTKKALQQHNVACHSGKGSMPKKSKPGPSQPKPKGQFGQGRTLLVSGSDLIGSVVVTDTDKAGKLLLAWDVNPTTLENSRLNHLAKTFARWRPKKLNFHTIPGMGVFTPGSYAMGWVGDPSFHLGDTSTRLARVSTLTPNVMSTFGQPQTLRVPMDTSQKWYFCHGHDEMETTHGMIVVVLAALVGGKNLSINFKLDWTVEFSSAEVPQSVQSLEIYPDPAYLPIFTDSVSDWASGERLTFKHAEGGSVVPWLGVRDDMVYKPADGVKIPYYDGTTQKNAGWFAAIGGIYPTGLACFASEADAKAYVKNKDFNKALKYSKAGEYTTPVLPTLIGKEVEEVGLDLRMKTLRHNKDVASLAMAASSLSFYNDGSADSPSFNTDFSRGSANGSVNNSFLVSSSTKPGVRFKPGVTKQPCVLRDYPSKSGESSFEDLGECL